MEEFTFEELAFIVGAYSVIARNSRITATIEAHVLDNATKISYQAAILLAQYFSYGEASEDLWTCLDIIVGKNVRAIDDSKIVHVVTTFAKSPYRREKLFLLFQNKIKDAQLSVSDCCKILRAYGEMEISHKQIYDIMDEKLRNKAGEMTDEDLINAHIGFLSSKTITKSTLSIVIENYIFENMNKVSLDDAVKLLNGFVKLKKGKNEQVKSCIKRIHELAVDSKMINPAITLS